jgi:acetyl esterase/lipase
MDPALFLRTPPPLDPAWLAHEKSANLLAPRPVITDPLENQKGYSERCKDLNASLLSGRDAHLTVGIKVHDTQVPTGSGGAGYAIPIRSYNPASRPEGPPPLLGGSRAGNGKGKGKGLSQEEGEEREELHPIVVYYHGGGLYVGDLDSEDLTCRRICISLSCTVYSIAYRLMPQVSAEVALSDALTAFRAICSTRKASRLILMGSSSGGQLAAQVAQSFRVLKGPGWETRIHGVALRGPVTCDATESGVNLPSKWRGKHFSMSEPFHTSLLSNAAVNASNRTTTPLPLEAEVDILSKQPRHWIQVCTNDIYYSDGVCYAAALEEVRVNVRLDVVEGWPHTFWLKAPLSARAMKAESDMIEGLRWLIQSEFEEDEAKVEKGPGGFVPFTNEEFEKQFMDM